MLKLSSGSCMLRLGRSGSALDHVCSGLGSGSGSASEEAADNAESEPKPEHA